MFTALLSARIAGCYYSHRIAIFTYGGKSSYKPTGEQHVVLCSKEGVWKERGILYKKEGVAPQGHICLYFKNYISFLFAKKAHNTFL